MTDNIGLDVELGVEDVVGPAQKGTRAVDGLLASFDRLASKNKTLMGIGPSPSSGKAWSFLDQKAKDPWYGVQEHARRLEQQMLAKKPGAKKSLGLDDIADEFSNLQNATGGLMGGGALGGVVDKLGAIGKMGGAGGAVGVLAALAAGCVALDLAIGALVVGGLSLLTYKFGEASAKAGMFAQESRLAMTQLLHGNAAEAASQFDDVRHSAAALGLQVQSTTSSFQALLRSQFKPELAKDILKMSSDLQSVGVHGEEVQGVILTLSQIKSKGKLQGEELMQLQERGISGELVQNAIMERMGLKNVAAYQKAQTGGKISSDVAIASILDAVKKKTGETELGQAGAMFAASTMSGGIAQMKGAWENLLIDAGDAMMPGLNEITSLIRGTFEDLLKSPEVMELGASLKEGWAEFVDWFKSAWPEISAMIPSVFDALNSGVQMAISAFRWLRENWDYVGPVLETGLYMVGGAFALLGAIGVAVMGSIAVAIEAFLLPFQMIGAAIWATIEAVERLWSVAQGAPDWFLGLLGMGGGGIDAIVSSQGAMNDNAQPTLRSGASATAAAAVSNFSNVRGDTNITIPVTATAPDGGTRADGEEWGKGAGEGISRKVQGYFAGAADNAA